MADGVTCKSGISLMFNHMMTIIRRLTVGLHVINVLTTDEDQRFSKLEGGCCCSAGGMEVFVAGRDDASATSTVATAVVTAPHGRSHHSSRDVLKRTVRLPGDPSAPACAPFVDVDETWKRRDPNEIGQHKQMDRILNQTTTATK